jgi:hypothetical protein
MFVSTSRSYGALSLWQYEAINMLLLRGKGEAAKKRTNSQKEEAAKSSYNSNGSDTGHSVFVAGVCWFANECDVPK